jgi:4-hydroxybenzoate polyprenyltransferase
VTESTRNSVGDAEDRRFDWRAHVDIARPDYWFKNVFVIPGIIIASAPSPGWTLATSPSASSSASSPRAHRVEQLHAQRSARRAIRPASPRETEPRRPSGRVRPEPPTQWLLLFAIGMALALTVSIPFALSLLALWTMAVVYNVPPMRSKDQPYVDVLSEAINNPLRMLAGWFIVTSATMAPASLLLSYWMIGCYFMALKRYAELASIGDRSRAGAYRRSFAFYTPERLIVAIMFYAAAAMLFFGAFCMRYRLELILSFPLVALVMAMYLRVALKPNSAAQNPVHLYRERGLMTAVVATTIVMVILLRVDLPAMHRLVTPTAPVQQVR